MPQLPDISPMELAALLCSRVCHDIISPVGAIANGLELLEEEGAKDMREVAMDLIKSSATNASAKLQFARIAFGAGGSAGAQIDTGEAMLVTTGYVEAERRTELVWTGERVLLPKNQVKLLLNMVLVGLGAIPRGGNLTVNLENTSPLPEFCVVCSGQNARVPPILVDLLNGTFNEDLDAHAIQPVYMMKLAESENMTVSAKLTGNEVKLRAISA